MITKTWSGLALLLAMGCHGVAHAADDTIIVTGAGIAQDRDASGQAITLIDAQTIERLQSQSVADLLATTPSVRVNGNGSLGSVTSVSLRGAEIGQTLVLLDGVRINDPSSTSSAVDFGNLLVANIRSIEIMRGANSVPFGSDAIGGVINLSTRDPDAPEGFSLRASAEGGYAGTGQGAADIGWRAGTARIDAGIALLNTDGISSADRTMGGTESDGLKNLTAHGRLEAQLAEGLTLDLRGYFVDARLAYDSFFGPPADSSDTSQFKQLTFYGGLNHVGFGGVLTSRASFTLLDNSRDYRFVPGTAAPDFGYQGNSWRADYQGILRPVESVDIVFGYTHDAPDYRFFGFGSDETHRSNTDSVHALAVLRPLAGLTLTGGVRHDDHIQFGGVTTFGANANYGLADGKTRVRAAFGEGFRAPSLYQLYDTFSGNPLLRPERSTSFDIGIDRRIADGHGMVALTLFTRTTRNQIDFDLSTFTYGNIARTRAQGVELSVDVKPVESLQLGLAYSFIDARDRSPGAGDAHLARRPEHSVTLMVDQRWAFGLSTGATLRMVSDSEDPTAPSGSIDGYMLLGLRASMPLMRGVELYGRIENLFDASYQTSYGYGTYGRAAYGGARVKL